MFYSTSKPLCSKPRGHVEICLEGSGLKGFGRGFDSLEFRDRRVQGLGFKGLGKEISMLRVWA